MNIHTTCPLCQTPLQPSTANLNSSYQFFICPDCPNKFISYFNQTHDITTASFKYNSVYCNLKDNVNSIKNSKVLMVSSVDNSIFFELNIDNYDNLTSLIDIYIAFQWIPPVLFASIKYLPKAKSIKLSTATINLVPLNILSYKIYQIKIGFLNSFIIINLIGSNIGLIKIIIIWLDFTFFIILFHIILPSLLTYP